MGKTRRKTQFIPIILHRLRLYSAHEASVKGSNSTGANRENGAAVISIAGDYGWLEFREAKYSVVFSSSVG
jgi:hypothetical protein